MNVRRNDKKKIEYVAFIIDESGSMMPTKKETINGINEQLQELRKTSSIETYVSIVKFSSTVETKVWNLPLAEVKDLTENDYDPCGTTAMLDAVGLTIFKLRNIEVNKDDDVSYLLIIVSDGQENSSKEYSWEEVRKLVTCCNEDKKWIITYMGANQDLSQVRESMNLQAANMVMYASTSQGTRSAYRGMSDSMALYRATRTNSNAEETASAGFYTITNGATNAKPEEV